MLLIPSLKYKTKKQSIRQVTSPGLLYLPLNGYGNEMEPVVRIGETVKKYQLVARSAGNLNTCIHSPVSGEVLKIEKTEDFRYLVLKNDFREDAVSLRKTDPDLLSKEEILDRIRESGITGSGGAIFPTHVKYNVEDGDVHTFIVNGAECEPYLSADYALMKEKTGDLINALKVVQQLLNADRIVFGIERQNKELKPVILKAAKQTDLPVSVKVLPDDYPQGGELQLIRSVTGKELPKGSIPSEHGIIVSNVGTLWAVYNAFFEGKPYTERVVTVSGNKEMNTGNFLVKIGTPAGHLLQETNNHRVPGKQIIVLGGPMMGKEAHHQETPITKGSGGVLILDNTKSRKNNCIECGYCVDVCPQRLMPLEFVRYGDELSQLSEYHLQDCIECGACAYICPSDVPLMESIFSGKQKLRAGK